MVKTKRTKVAGISVFSYFFIEQIIFVLHKIRIFAHSKTMFFTE